MTEFRNTEPAPDALQVDIDEVKARLALFRELRDRCDRYEIALHRIAKTTYEVQYDPVPDAVVKFAGPLHTIAREALEPRDGASRAEVAA